MDEFELSICVKRYFIYFIELCKNGVDQRDFFYFMGIGYYKLEVNSVIACVYCIIMTNIV